MTTRRFSKKANPELSHNAKAAVFFGSLSITIALVVLIPTFAFAEAKPGDLAGQLNLISGGGISKHPLILMFGMIGISLLPFVGMLVTSFVKIAVVLSITRQAIAIQQAPPTTVITGLALILTIYVMHPVGMQIYEKTEKHFAHQNNEFFDKENIDVLFKMVTVAKEPLKDFLRHNAYDKNIQTFYHLGYRMRASEQKINFSPNDLLVLVPAFVITELTKAFQIGFIIFLPFLVIDMAIANILMALGMQLLSPTTISLPFKILLFVMVDGWRLITKGLVLGYQVS